VSVRYGPGWLARVDPPQGHPGSDEQKSRTRLYETALPNGCPTRKGGMSLITIAILVLHLLAPAHAGSLKDAQDDIKAFRNNKGTFIFYCPRCKHAETKLKERAA